MTCAFAVRGAIKKIAGVESVDVSLNKGLASVRLKPGNSATLTQFWETIKNNGFTPKETRVSLTGELAQSSGKFRVQVTPGGQSYPLQAPSGSKVLDGLAGKVGTKLHVDGKVIPPKDLKSQVPVEVQSIRPGGV